MIKSPKFSPPISVLREEVVHPSPYSFLDFVGLVNKSSRSFLSTCSLDTATGQESEPRGSHHVLLITLSLDTVEDVMGGEVDEMG